MSGLAEFKAELSKHANPAQAKLLQRFFKTADGEYGAGDVFLGIKVPVQRSIAKKYQNMTLFELQELLNNKIHEHRMCALFILVDMYKKYVDKKQIFEFYLSNYKNINNWDLVDLSAPNIVGDYLLNHPRKILYELARSDSLWKKRIAMLATYTFIRSNQFDDTLKIAEILLKDKHDLIHKAVGWMLREAGKRNQVLEEQFLKHHYKTMPRTMLRYAIEKFTETKRKFYLNK